MAAGLAGIGLPRGPVREVRIDRVRPGLNGQKLRDCTIVLVGDYVRAFVTERNQPDPVFRTWIHESIHARQPYAPGAAAEYQAFRGYEEGLVEGLTQIALAAASISVSDTPFGAYVEAYRALTAAIGSQLETLLRSLWRFPTGEVRLGLPEVVAELHNSTVGVVLPLEARVRLQAVSDRLFVADRGGHTPDPAILAMLWRRALT